MITNSKEYRAYLEADRIALGRRHAFGFTDWLMDDIWKFERRMRLIDYLQHAKRGIFWKFVRHVIYWWHHRQAVKLGFSFAGEIGPGLSIAHYGPIIVSHLSRIGKNCRIHVGVNIGEQDGGAPVLGDNCYIGPGAKLFGKIVVGDNVKIGANAVVNKSFPEGNCTLVGVPAQKVEK